MPTKEVLNWVKHLDLRLQLLSTLLMQLRTISTEAGTFFVRIIICIKIRAFTFSLFVNKEAFEVGFASLTFVVSSLNGMTMVVCKQNCFK